MILHEDCHYLASTVVAIVAGFVALVLLVLLVGYSVSTYNQLVSLRERVDQSKQNIDVLLEQRQDGLTKLIDAAKEFREHEEEVLPKLTQARERAEQAKTPEQQANADRAVRGALVFWATLALLPGINVLTTLAYLATRRDANEI